MTRDNEKFIEYWKCLNQSAKIIKRKNLSEKDKIKINNLYEKADKLLLEINKKNLKSSYSTTGIIVGSISAAAITGAMLYYFNKKSLEKDVVDFSNLEIGSRIKIDGKEYTFVEYISQTKSILYTDDKIIHTNAESFKDILDEKEKASFDEFVNDDGIGQEINYKAYKILNIDGHNIEIIN